MNKSFLFFVGLFLMVQGVLIYVKDTLGFPSFVVGSFVNLWGTIICIEINKKQN